MILLVFLSFLFFILGIETFSNWKIVRLKIFPTKYHFPKKRLAQIIGLLTIISIIADLMILKNLLSQQGSLIQIISYAAVIRNKIVRGELNVLSFYGYFSALSFPAVILSGIFGARYGFLKFFSLISFLPVMLFAFIFMGRANFLWAILLYFNAYILTMVVLRKRLITKKRLIQYSILFLLLLILINVTFYFRGGKEIKLYYARYLNYEEPENFLSRIAFANYVYIVSSIPALDVFVENYQTPLLLGAKSFRPLIFLIEKKYRSIYYPFVKIPISVNTYSYLADAYMDFGLAGFVIIPFILGAISILAYHYYNQKPTAFSIGILATIYSNLEYSILYSKFTHGNIWITILILIILKHYLEEKFDSTELSKKVNK